MDQLILLSVLFNTNQKFIYDFEIALKNFI